MEAGWQCLALVPLFSHDQISLPLILPHLKNFDQVANSTDVCMLHFDGSEEKDYLRVKS